MRGAKDWLWLGGFLALLALVSWVVFSKFPGQPLEIAAFYTGLLYVGLMARQWMIVWPVGIVNALVTAYVFAAQFGLYADATLYLIYFGFMIWGWFTWAKGDTQGRPLKVTRLPGRGLLLAAGIWLAGICLLAPILMPIKGAAGGYTWWTAAADSSMLFGSLVCQFLDNRKKLEAWFGWIIVNSVAIALYTNQKAEGFAVQAAIYMALTVYGLAAWLKSQRKERKCDLFE